MTVPANKAIELRRPDASNLDSPFEERVLRLYVAVTNKCNRACPFCSVYASTTGKTFIKLEQIVAHVPKRGPYQVQLEGGEPFLHPAIFTFTRHFSEDPRCTKIIISTNGSKFPFVVDERGIDPEASWPGLLQFFSRLPKNSVLKISLNHYLLENDPHLFSKAKLILDTAQEQAINVVFNLRKRNASQHECDAYLETLVDKHGLRPFTNSFYLQRYGRNANDENAEAPYLVGTNWCAVNPDGKAWGIDLIGRSDAMRRLP
nr:radical SAM protein [Candidatus Sigynarchaeota archaeon]